MLRFKKNIESLDYDYIFIDTPPAVTSYEFNASMFVSDLILSPIGYSRWTIQSIQIIQREIVDIPLCKNQTNSGISIKIFTLPEREVSGQNQLSKMAFS